MDTQGGAGQPATKPTRTPVERPQSEHHAPTTTPEPTEETFWSKVVRHQDRLHGPDWRDKQHPIEMLLWGIGELGEAINDYKHFLGSGTHKVDINPADIPREFVDWEIYLIMALEGMGITEEIYNEAREYKLGVLLERFKDISEKKRAE